MQTEHHAYKSCNDHNRCNRGYNGCPRCNMLEMQDLDTLRLGQPIPVMSRAEYEIMKAVERESVSRKPKPNAVPGAAVNGPGHGHRVPGVWDEDNGSLSGHKCAWCLTWNHFSALLKAEAER